MRPDRRLPDSDHPAAPIARRSARSRIGPRTPNRNAARFKAPLARAAISMRKVICYDRIAQHGAAPTTDTTDQGRMDGSGTRRTRASSARMNSAAKHCQQNFGRYAAFAQTIGHRPQQQCSEADSNGHDEELVDHALPIKPFDVSEPGCSPQRLQRPGRSDAGCRERCNSQETRIRKDGPQRKRLSGSSGAAWNCLSGSGTTK